MKKILLLSIALSAVMMSCETKKSKEPSDQSLDSVTNETNASAALPSQAYQEENLHSVAFPIECANTEIESLLTNRILKRWAKNFALGGTFNDLQEVFPKDNENDSDGVMMWFNIDNIEGKPTLAMAIEKANRRSGPTPDHPVAETLTYPNSTFTLERKQPFNLRNRVALTHRKIKNRKEVKANVNGRRAKFDTQLGEDLNPDDNERFNKHNGAFFQNNPDSATLNVTKRGLLSRLVNQHKAVGIRYYLALKDASDYENKIRIILVAVDSLGNDILEVPHPSIKDATQPALLVQKSIPPGQLFKSTGKCP